MFIMGQYFERIEWGIKSWGLEEQITILIFMLSLKKFALRVPGEYTERRK
jgi:hypothetical protein